MPSVRVPRRFTTSMEEDFLPFRLDDYVMVAPRDPARPNAYTRTHGDMIHKIVGFYISIASYRCAYVKQVDGEKNSVGVRIERLTHTTQNATWEV